MSTQLHLVDQQERAERQEPRIALSQVRELSCENTQHVRGETPDTHRDLKAPNSVTFDKSVSADGLKKTTAPKKQLIRFASVKEGSQTSGGANCNPELGSVSI